MKPDPMAEDEIKKMLDNTILDWNRPSQLTDISADANYRKLIPAINAYTTNKIIEVTKSKDYAYWERNQLVGVLSRLYPSHLAKHPESDKEWEDDWRNIVCVHTPAGQATWHLHDSDMPMFKHLEVGKDHWDGHTTEEKYKRLEALNHRKERDE